MRKDMKKVIITRPRTGGGAVRPIRKKIRVQDLDEFNDIDDGYPNKVSAKLDATGFDNYDGKRQTDLLGPLRRYLVKQVGRKWDDVWSEICEDNKDFMGEHLKTHVEYEVETNCYIDEEGDVRNSYGSLMDRPRWMYRENLYVHPETNILMASKVQKRERYKKPYQIVTMDGQEYYKHEGIWYRVKTAKLDTEVKHKSYPFYVQSEKDVFGNIPYLASIWSAKSAAYNAYGGYVICIWKQQANSKECKRLNKLVKKTEEKQAA